MKQGKFFIMRFGLNLDNSIIDYINTDTGGFENDDLDYIEDKLNYTLKNCKGEQKKELFEFIEEVIEDVKLQRSKLKKKIENSDSNNEDELDILLRNRLKIKMKFLRKWLKSKRKIRKDHIENTYNTRIFESYESELLFEFLKEKMGQNGAVISFIFRKLIEDSYISADVGINEFKRVLHEDYDLSIDKIKQLHQVSNSERLALYESLIKQFYKE